MIERVMRVATSFREAERMDRADLAAMSFEERTSAVERMRRERFGEDRAESRLDRVLVKGCPAQMTSNLSGRSFSIIRPALTMIASYRLRLDARGPSDRA